jgi:hypothetical protein
MQAYWTPEGFTTPTPTWSGHFCRLIGHNPGQVPLSSPELHQVYHGNETFTPKCTDCRGREKCRRQVGDTDRAPCSVALLILVNDLQCSFRGDYEFLDDQSKQQLTKPPDSSSLQLQGFQSWYAP